MRLSFVKEGFFPDRMDFVLSVSQRSPLPLSDDYGDGRDALPLDPLPASDREASGFSLLLALS